MKHRLHHIICKFRINKNIDSLKQEYFKICMIYMMIGFFWIYFSDSAVMHLFQNKNIIHLVNTYKGFLYVIVTAIILFQLIEKLVNKVQLAERALNSSKEELVAANEELQSYVEQITQNEEELRAQFDQLTQYGENLMISEEKYKALINQMNLGIALYVGKKGEDILDYRLVDANDCHEKLTGLLRIQVIGKYFKEVHPNYEQEHLIAIRNTIKTGVPCSYERYKETTNTYYEILAYRPMDNQLAVIVNNITKRKLAEEKLQYLSVHDQLTGLYNRRFFEQEMVHLNQSKYLPLTITLADINGLKLINDSFGHTAGDNYIIKTAQILQKVYRTNDVVCRLSGDEFIILSPNTDLSMAENLVHNYYERAKNETINAIELSISIGYSTKYYEDENLLDTYKKAESYMYKKKLLESPSMRGKTINTIITTLHEKNKREELHSRRVSQLCEKMGEALGYSEDKIKELKLVGLLHDIGKIAIEEGILNKPGKLTQDEWEEIKKHPEIGYRILSTVNDLSEMAEYVLAHHERWDGTGYPKGLKEEEIPVESRIIAIADTYDAMVSERSYRAALSKEFAIEELLHNKGAQFCPELVNVFVKKVV